MKIRRIAMLAMPLSDDSDHTSIVMSVEIEGAESALVCEVVGNDVLISLFETVIDNMADRLKEGVRVAIEDAEMPIHKDHQFNSDVLGLIDDVRKYINGEDEEQ